MTLHKLRVAALTHLEAGQLIKSSIKDLETQGIKTTTDRHIAKYVQKLKDDTVLYDKGLLQIQKNEETEELVRLDRIRDLSVGAYNKQLDVFENTRNANKLAAYKSLEIVANKFKDLVNLNYEAESNAIDNLLQELASPTHAPHIATLNMGEFVEDIQQTNEAFKLKFSQRSAHISSTEIFNMKLIRKATFENYNKYIQYVESLSNVDTGNDYYKKILNIINQNRKYHSDILARRQGRNDNPASGETPT
jgi:electron transfer flavoprotein alpha subunit